MSSEKMLEVTSLDLDGRGVGRLNNENGTAGKVIFVEGALPGEVVSYESFRKKKQWEVAKMTGLHRESALRAVPKCTYFGTCGGCTMQHLEPSAQVAVKQRVLEDTLWHIGKIKADMIMRPIYGPAWGYRYRARLSVKYVRKKEKILIGFHEKKSAFVTDMTSCAILPEHISELLIPLRHLIVSLSIREKIPQIELAVGDSVTALVLRIMADLSETDFILLKEFSNRHKIQWWLQPKGPETAYLFYPEHEALYYDLPEFGVRLPFKPVDFTQVNHAVNRVMLDKALRALNVQPHERIADFFCGLGNFTLPIATQARTVVGMEGSRELVTRALENARINGLDSKISFWEKNLFEIKTQDLLNFGKFDRFLIDPPRDGAMALCEALVGLNTHSEDIKPKRIVYISCNPATLARDAGVLLHQAGYALSHAGVMNMFPHTSHLESMAVFERAC